MILAIFLIIAALAGCIWLSEGPGWLGGLVLTACAVIALWAY